MSIYMYSNSREFKTCLSYGPESVVNEFRQNSSGQVGKIETTIFETVFALALNIFIAL